MREKNANGRQQIVIVIDDDSAVLSSLRFSLELEGFDVEAYRSGGEVLAQETHPTAGCLVIDYNLPDMNGLELLSVLRRSHVVLPAILITTHPSALLLRNAAAAGVPIVEKPLLGNALIDAIRHALAHKAAPSS
jgi:FixJ family two-component response regulator